MWCPHYIPMGEGYSTRSSTGQLTYEGTSPLRKLTPPNSHWLSIALQIGVGTLETLPTPSDIHGLGLRWLHTGNHSCREFMNKSTSSPHCLPTSPWLGWPLSTSLNLIHGYPFVCVWRFFLPLQMNSSLWPLQRARSYCRESVLESCIHLENTFLESRQQTSCFNQSELGQWKNN